MSRQLPLKGADEFRRIAPSTRFVWTRIPKLAFVATRYAAAVPGVAFSDETICLELAKPYCERAGMRSLQADVDRSLDAFNLWKRTKKTPY